MPWSVPSRSAPSASTAWTCCPSGGKRPAPSAPSRWSRPRRWRPSPKPPAGARSTPRAKWGGQAAPPRRPSSLWASRARGRGAAGEVAARARDRARVAPGRWRGGLPQVRQARRRRIEDGVDNMNPSKQLSHAVGATHPPLIEQTIGRCFEAVDDRLPDHEALVSCQQGLRYTYSQLNREANRLASALLRVGLRTGDRVGIWSHNNAQWLLTQLATAKVGIVLVNINPAYRASELDYAPNKVGCRMLITMTAFKTTDYLEIVRELAPELAGSTPGALDAPQLPQLRWVVHLGSEAVPGTLRFEDLAAQGDADDPAVQAAGAALKPTDPINIQFTSGTTGFPKGATLSHRNILNNGFFVGEAMRFTENDRLCVPVPLYHCFGMVMGNLNCLTHGATIVYPDEAFDVHRDPVASAVRPIRSAFAAHRLHGGFALSDRGHAARGERHAHGRSDHRLRHDRDQPGELPEHGGHAAGPPGWHRRDGASASRDQAGRSGNGADRRQGRDGRVLHPRLLGHERLLVRRGAHPRGDRRRGMDAHRRPGHDGRRGLRQHRRAHQGHGDSRRRERLPAGDRRVPVRASRGQGRTGGRRARPQVRLRTLRVGDSQARPRADGGRTARALQRPYRALQGAALRALRRGVPDDHHREDPEIPHPRSHAGRAWSGSRADRLMSRSPYFLPHYTPERAERTSGALALVGALRAADGMEAMGRQVLEFASSFRRMRAEQLFAL